VAVLLSPTGVPLSVEVVPLSVSVALSPVVDESSFVDESSAVLLSPAVLESPVDVPESCVEPPLEDELEQPVMMAPSAKSPAKVMQVSLFITSSPVESVDRACPSWEEEATRLLSV
jgi:hypothetical protein